LRVLAVQSEDPYLIQIFKDGFNLHDKMAEGMYGANYTKLQRQWAKTITFGIIYGRGPSAIAKEFGITVGEAKTIINDWFRPVPKVRLWINNRRKMAMTGAECRTPFNRVRSFVVTDENAYNIQNEYINTPIQSTASDLTLISMCDVHDYLKANKIDAKIVSTTHDSIMIEIRDDENLIQQVAEKVIEIMRNLPEKYFDPKGVPFYGEPEVGKSWGELKPLEVWREERCANSEDHTKTKVANGY